MITASYWGRTLYKFEPVIKLGQSDILIIFVLTGSIFEGTSFVASFVVCA